MIFMRKFNLFLMSCLLATSMFFVTGCGDKDDPDNSSKTVPDPEGTMIVHIRNDTHQTWTGSCFCGMYYGIANIGIGTLEMMGTNFSGFWGEFEVAYVGTINGLGSIKSIPNGNLFTTNGAAALEKGGYVARNTTSDDQVEYARFYVSRYLTSGGGIVGAEIKYQYPWEP